MKESSNKKQAVEDLPNFVEISSSTSSNKRHRSDPSVTALVNQFTEMSITLGESTSSSSIPKRKRSSLEAFNTASSSIQEIRRCFKHSSFTNSSAPKIMVSTSTSSIKNTFKYDVFICFRGEDTRKTFVDHLYCALKDKGIYTYKDDETIHKRERISDELIKAIEDFKFYIIVFSKNYASLSWCLEDLVKISES
uniref:Toll/interleukin-1 receptor (TIR) domain-containing protein n=1 Tax=Tanacetum cinerariifolium TaxID=118510 RepID=A0A699H039_TANCI|nr:Toll/interleukin-1 receptor (TIR) domain-containing protein [Tanacetum cinerariifolium]